jgi:hypothetical protein
MEQGWSNRVPGCPRSRGFRDLGFFTIFNSETRFIIDCYDFVYNTPNNLPGGNFKLQNTREDRYNAFQLTLRRSFRQRYSVMGSYTRSNTHSNQALDFNVDAPILGRVLPRKHYRQPASSRPFSLGRWQSLPLLGLSAILPPAHHPRTGSRLLRRGAHRDSP